MKRKFLLMIAFICMTYFLIGINSTEIKADNGTAVTNTITPSVNNNNGVYSNNVKMDIIGPDVTVGYDFTGKYQLNYAGSSNFYGKNDAINGMGGFIYDGKPGTIIPPVDESYGSYNSNTSSLGTLDLATMQFRTDIKGNASKARLVPGKNAEGENLDSQCIKKAFLIVESSVDKYAPNLNVEQLTEMQNMGNRPMTLVGPSGDTTNSTGILPEGFSMRYDGSASSNNSELDTSSSSLSQGTPTILFSLGYAANRIRISTITDVTDFVKKEGYGEYYGYNVPTKASENMADTGTGWKLIILEEDSTMPLERLGSLEIGVINTNKNNLGEESVRMDLTLGGYTTPRSYDFTGQLFFSSFGSNPQSSQYSVGLAPSSDYSNRFSLNTWDRSNFTISRGSHDGFTSFGQNIISVDGQRRTDYSSFRLNNAGISSLTESMPANTLWNISDYINHANRYPYYTDGMDIELLHVTNNSQDIEIANHNAYLSNGTDRISLEITPSPDGDNFITALGVVSDLSIPIFSTSINHTDLANDEIDKDVLVQNKIRITGNAKNVSLTQEDIAVTSNTQTTFTLDDSLSVDWDTLSIKFRKYNTESSDYTEYSTSDFTEAATLDSLNQELKSNYFYIDKASKKITINWGFEGNGFEHQSDISTGKYVQKKLLNKRSDEIKVEVEAYTDSNTKNDITNQIEVSVKDYLTDDNLILSRDSSIASSASNVFNTYDNRFLIHIRQVIINSKNDVVVPVKGYGNLKINERGINATFSSSDDNSVSYDNFSIQFSKAEENSNIIFKVFTVPQYYELIGYGMSVENVPHDQSQLIQDESLSLSLKEQYWVTIYLEPSSDKDSSMYSWDYALNDLGRVTR